MATANLDQKATLESMVRLGDTAAAALEKPGGEPTTSASRFKGRWRATSRSFPGTSFIMTCTPG